METRERETRGEGPPARAARPEPAPESRCEAECEAAIGGCSQRRSVRCTSPFQHLETLKFISLKVLSCLEVIFAGFQIDLPRGRASQTR